MAVLMYKALHDLLPEDCQLVSVTGRQRLRLSDIDTRHMPSAVKTNTHLGDCSLLDLKYGTVCQPRSESRTLNWDNFDEHSKCNYMYLVLTAAVQSDSLFCALCINRPVYTQCTKKT